MFILGFEAGIPEVRRNHPIVRSGAIARIRDLYEGDSDFFMAEATVFNGTSGGPVFLRSASDSGNDNRTNDPVLIGVVSAYWSYAQQTVNANFVRNLAMMYSLRNCLLTSPHEAALAAFFLVHHPSRMVSCSKSVRLVKWHAKTSDETRGDDPVSSGGIAISVPWRPFQNVRCEHR